LPYPYRARVTLHAPVEAVAKKIPASAGVLEAINDNSCMLHTGSHSLEGITIHLSLLGVEFQVHEPVELIDYVRKLTERLGRAVAAPSEMSS
jgi:predicted DNA-binding transcriptional regulator YafY